MPLDLPPNYNFSTQIKERVELVSYGTSTRVDNLSKKIADLTVHNHISNMNFSNSTILFIKRELHFDNSTWSDSKDENFEIVSKLTYSKVFKVQAKIIKVSKFLPKIIVD